MTTAVATERAPEENVQPNASASADPPADQEQAITRISEAPGDGEPPAKRELIEQIAGTLPEFSSEFLARLVSGLKEELDGKSERGEAYDAEKVKLIRLQPICVVSNAADHNSRLPVYGVSCRPGLRTGFPTPERACPVLEADFPGSFNPSDDYT